MDFLELAKSRYSVRSFKATPVSDEEIMLILQAAQAAPTACNIQPQRIIAVKSAEGIEKFRKCTPCHFNAPLAFIVCHDTEKCWKRSYDGKSSGDIDASIVATHMMLEAYELNIGSTWVMYFIPEAVKTEFDLPDNIEPTAVLVMGYPSEECVPSKLHFDRKSKEEYTTFA